MARPSLRLAFLEGPRDGDTLDYAPGSTIRLGRILRGNEIAVKDAGISTKHLRIASVSENWVIQDLGSSNGTVLNSNPLDPDTPVDLRDGDIIKLGESTSIVVNFVIDVQGKKRPPPPRRNTRRQASADPKVEVKPAKKRTRVSGEKGLNVEIENKPSSRVRKASKIEKLGTSNGLEEEFLEEEKGNSRIQKTRKATCIWRSIKVGTEEATMAVENSGKGTKNGKTETVEKSCLGLVNVKKGGAAEEGSKEMRITRATRSKKIEIAGDCYLELEMVLNQARKRCGRKKKAEQFKDDAREQDPKCCSAEQDMKNVSNAKSVGMVEVDIGKMTLRDFFDFLEVQLPKQIYHETERMIEPMRSKAQRVHEYVAEQKILQARAFVARNDKVRH